MPLRGVSRRTSPLGAFTYRELLAHRRRAERALSRGRSPDAARDLLDRIDAELASRRTLKLDREEVPAL